MLLPSSRTSRMRSSRRLCMNITPSMNWTPLRRQAARISRTSPAVAADGLFGQHVFSGLRRPDQPRLADAGRQGNIHGIHRVAGQQLLVAAEGLRRRIEGNVPLALSDVRAGTAQRSRLATAVKAQFCALRMASQFLRAISAVPKIPHRQTALGMSQVSISAIRRSVLNNPGLLPSQGGGPWRRARKAT